LMCSHQWPIEKIPPPRRIGGEDVNGVFLCQSWDIGIDRGLRTTAGRFGDALGVVEGIATLALAIARILAAKVSGNGGPLPRSTPCRSFLPATLPNGPPPIRRHLLQLFFLPQAVEPLLPFLRSLHLALPRLHCIGGRALLSNYALYRREVWVDGGLAQGQRLRCFHIKERHGARKQTKN
jgi:hypothetical protein